MEKKGMEMFDFYKNILTPWPDMFGAWMKKAEGGFPQPFTSVEKMTETASKSITLYAELYGACLKSLNDVVGKSFELNRKFVVGEKTDTGQFIETLKEACENVSEKITLYLENTPFEGIISMEKAVKKSLNAYDKEQEKLRAFLQEVVDFDSRMINIFKSSNGNAAKVFSYVLQGKIMLSDEHYDRMIKVYKELLEHSPEMLRPAVALQPEYKDTVNELIVWVKKNVELLICVQEINFKPYREASKISMEFYNLIEEAFKEGDSLDELYNRWLEVGEKARSRFISDAHSYEMISEFFEKNTEFIKSAKELYQNAAPHLPYTANGYSKLAPDFVSPNTEAA
jgi:Rad3-related DNA helicase